MLDALRMRMLLQRFGFRRQAAELRSLIRPCVTLQTRRISQSALRERSSRFGGLPPMAEGQPWPQGRQFSMSFLGMIRLSEVPRAWTDLPAKGLLYFWYDDDAGVWGFDPSDRDGFCVQYFPNEQQALRLAQHPPMPSSDRGFPRQYRSCALTFRRQISLPSWSWILERREDLSSALGLDRYEEFRDAMREQRFGHRIGGYPQEVQNPMEEECESVSRRAFPEDRENHPESSKDATSDWRLLLQIDSDEAPDWMWCDAGMLYFCIPRTALVERRFDRSWLTLQCY